MRRTSSRCGEKEGGAEDDQAGDEGQGQGDFHEHAVKHEREE